MAGKIPLKIQAGFGQSAATARLFATHEDEEDQSDTPRCFVLSLTGTTATWIDTSPHGVISAWQSPSGTAYCSTLDGRCLVYRNGVKTVEQIVTRSAPIGPIWGLGGASAEADVVFACAATSIVIRQHGKWREVPVPEDKGEIEEVNSIHGLSFDDLYVCTSAGLMHWDGTRLEPIADPDDDEDIPLDICVRSPTEMLAVSDDQLYSWQDGRGWKKLRAPRSDYGGSILPFGEGIYLSALEGPLLLKGDKVQRVADFECIRLFSLGDALLGVGSEGASLFDGTKWSKVETPLLKAGEKSPW